MKIVYFGSGAFGLPTLRRLAREHDVLLAVTQPDRPSGRGRTLAPTPVAEFAQKRSIEVIRPEDVNEPSVVREIRGLGAAAHVVIAYGQKIAPPLREDVLHMNLHASLLPKYRGAAPINWAMINGEKEAGVTVIALADRMDAGDMYGRRSTPIDPFETAAELGERLADLGADLVIDVLAEAADGKLDPVPQDESLATRAPKLSKADGTVRFDRPAGAVRARIHGLTPWPGCTVRLGDTTLKLLRAGSGPGEAGTGAVPGDILEDGSVCCASGVLHLLSVQPAGGKAMTFDAFRRGHRVAAGARLEPR
jgi:methionyl-tRNA formyltransferase